MECGEHRQNKITNEIAGSDFGAVMVRPNAAGKTLADAVGGTLPELAFDPPVGAVQQGVVVIGYPGERPFNGTAQYQCAQTSQVLPEPGTPGTEWRIGCTMTPGCSGAPGWP